MIFFIIAKRKYWKKHPMKSVSVASGQGRFGPARRRKSYACFKGKPQNANVVEKHFHPSRGEEEKTWPHSHMFNRVE